MKKYLGQDLFIDLVGLHATVTKMQTLFFFVKINQTSGVHQKQDCLSWYLTSVYWVSCQKEIVKYSVQHLKTSVLYS